jgi:branched-subunit amino acid aminotransferase/4-amino-4-deoxychorismate lyase
MRQFAAGQIEINGRAPTPDQFRAMALNGYGHFTAMQVRNGRVRGLALHLARLHAASAELFGTSLDGALVRERIRHALAAGAAATAGTGASGIANASVRVYVQWPDPQEPPSVMVTVRPPGEMPAEFRLKSVPYQRSIAHIKHLGDFGQHYYGLLAERSGYDEALLTGPDGLISEGSVTNVGFFDGTAVIWPAAPMLTGITMQLLQHGLAAQSVPMRHDPVRLADFGTFALIFVTNSRGIAAVTQVDGRSLHVEADCLKRLADIYAASPWDLI